MFDGKHILIVDSSPAIRDYTQTIFTRQGASVESVGSGRAALDMLGHGDRYDLVLIDLALPDVSGIDLLETIRRENVQVALVVTGDGDVASALAAGQHGADAYVKNHDVTEGSDSEFLRAIERALEQRRGRVAPRQGNSERERTEEVLRMIEQIHASVISVDSDGHVTSWNKGSEKLLGYSGEEALGRHISFVLPEEERLSLSQRVVAPVEMKGNHEVEMRMRRKSGIDFYAHVSLSLLRDMASSCWAPTCVLALPTVLSRTCGISPTILLHASRRWLK